MIRRSLVCTLSFFLLYFSGFLAFWSPLPLVYLSLRKEKEAWRISLLSILFLILFLYAWGLPHFLGLFFSLYYWLVGFVLSVGVWRRWSLTRWGFFSGLWVTGGIFLLAGLVQLSGFFDFQKVWGEISNQTLVMMDQFNTLSFPPEKRIRIADSLAQMKLMLPLFPMFLPALFFTLTLLILAANIACLNLFRRFLKACPGPWNFRRLQLPDPCLWSLILSASLFFLNAYFLHQEWLKILTSNLLICIIFIYFFQGLSIGAFFIGRYSVLFQVGIYGLLILFFHILAPVVIGLGVADIWVDFRKLRVKLKGKG